MFGSRVRISPQSQKNVEPTFYFCKLNTIYNKLIENQDIVFQLNPKETTIYGYCEKCGAELHSKTKHNMCSTCVKKYVLCKVKNKPTREELLKLLETNSYESVGRMYGVSGNAIKKWLKNLMKK